MLHPAIFEDTVGAGIVSSLGPAAWFRANTGITVTGLGVSQWDDQSGNARHLLQGTDANRPIGLIHSGTNYLYLSGIAGNYASTPDPTAFPTGDIDVRVRLSLNDWTPAAVHRVLSKYLITGNQRTITLGVGVTGTLTCITSADGTATIATASTATVTASDGDRIWVRYVVDVDNGAAGHDVKYYTAADSDAEPAVWTQLGTTVTTAGTTSLFNSTQVVELGARESGAADLLIGKIYRASIYSTIGGTTPVVDFNPALATDQAATFVASTGETWTINSTGSKPAQIVASSRLLGDGAAHKMAAAYTANQALTRFVLGYAISWTAGDYLISGATGECGITQVTGTPTIGLNAGSAAASNGDMTLGTWKVLTAVINGASSSLTVNAGTPATGNAGANNSGGITLFSNAAGAGYFNGMVKEIIDFQGVLSTANIARVQRYLSRVGQLGF